MEDQSLRRREVPLHEPTRRPEHHETSRKDDDHLFQTTSVHDSADQFRGHRYHRGSTGDAVSCAGCEALTARLDRLERRVADTSAVLPRLSSIEKALRRVEGDVDHLVAALLHGREGLTSEQIDACDTTADRIALFEQQEADVRKRLQADAEAAEMKYRTGTIDALKTMATRIVSLEHDLDDVIASMKDGEERSSAWKKSVEGRIMDKAEFAPSVVSLIRGSRDEGLELCRYLCGVLGADIAEMEKLMAAPSTTREEKNKFVFSWPPFSTVGHALKASDELLRTVLEARTAVPVGPLLKPMWQRQLGLELEEGANGLQVTAVWKGSPAEAAGMSDGDNILSINGIVLRDLADLQRAFTVVLPNTVVRIRRMRRGSAAPPDIVQFTTTSF